MIQVKLLIVSITFCLVLGDYVLHTRGLQRDMASQPLHAEAQTGDSIRTFVIAAVGDLMCHGSQFRNVALADGSYDFQPCFEFITPYIAGADFAVGNLETTFAGDGIPYSGFPLFNTPDAFATALKTAGFDFVTTGNNHSNDMGTNGILRTIDVLDSVGLLHTGTFKSQAERDSVQVIQIAGTDVAILNYTYSTNGIDLPPDKSYLVNSIDSATIVNDIQQAKNRQAELVIVYYHYGEEYRRMPSDYQKKYNRIAINAGADIILGSHPHVIEPAAFFPTVNAAIDTGFVIYSMGNFISNQRDPFTYEGVIINLHFEKNLRTNKLKLQTVDYVPTWVYRGTNPEKKLHVVFPATDTIQPQADYLKLKDKLEILQAKKNTAAILNTYTDRLQPVEK